ncbi:UV radiation resistance protein and autophagy-related subunit 14-domain-containing protein [Apiospora arundinis]|uniref:Autophagy-related protein 14 n=1 Tax=Apiospora arundinis TaxID=335852 RepID=A0ABR2HQW6_9PEZI
MAIWEFDHTRNVRLHTTALISQKPTKARTTPNTIPSELAIMDHRAQPVSCGVCQRQHHPQRLPFYCVVDARNMLYESRIKHANNLMETTRLDGQINALELGDDPDSATPTPIRATRRYVDQCVSAAEEAEDETEQIIATAERLQQNIDKAKKDLEARKAKIARRKADLASLSQGIAARRNRELEETSKAIKMTKYTWDREYEAMAHYRAALCTEVAKIYRLQRIRRVNPVRFEYKIGGIDIVDLHQMSNMTPEHISASLGHVAHLLWLAAHYLEIRLPAEITLPHNDYPKPTIFSLVSSYHHGQVPFPGSSQLPNDPRDRGYSHVPHPRPLFLDKPLSTLAKEDSPTYTAFTEGACLLAYDIVWLCRTQGIPVGDNSNNFDDFACMGRNLYNLLIGSSLQRNQPGQQPLLAEADPSSSPGRRGTNNTSAADNINNNNVEGGGDPTSDLMINKTTTPRMGQWSHGTAHTYLGGAAGHDFTKYFKLPNPLKLADQLRARLVNEAPSAPEWELIEDDEFGPNDLDDGVLVGGTPRSRAKGPQRFGLESYMSVNTVKGGGGLDASSPRAASGISGGVYGKDREKNTNGWTKIKPR